MAKQKLVVIGNGMAGARAVEEVLARGGAEQFDIVMFGDEPYGNYNRIMLSNVLNGSYKEDEIYLNPLDWYRENNIRLLSGTRAAGILRRARLVYAEDGTPEPYDKLIIATGSRTEIVLSVGFRLGNLARFALDQSTNSVESAPAPFDDQNSNSSVSFLNLGIAFFMPFVLLGFSSAHIPHRDNPDLLSSNRESYK